MAFILPLKRQHGSKYYILTANLNSMNKFLLIIFLSILTFFTDCNNFLNLQPIHSPTEGNFYTDEGGLQGALVSCYDALQSDFLYGNNFLVLDENRGDNVADNSISF